MPRNRSSALKLAREARDREATELYCLGWSQSRIAAKFDLQQPAVSKIIAAARRLWQQQMAEDFDSLKAEQLGKIDATEAQAWRGWRRSLRTAEKKQAKRVDEAGTVKQETTKTEEAQTGDPRFLGAVLNCIERRCKLIGADAPKRIDLSMDELRSMTGEQLRAIAEGKPV